MSSNKLSRQEYVCYKIRLLRAKKAPLSLATGDIYITNKAYDHTRTLPFYLLLLPILDYLQPLVAFASFFK